MKKFKDLFKEEIAADQKRKKGEDKPPKYLKPVSKGEQEFADKHTVDKKDYPVPSDAQFTGDHKGPAPDLPHEGGKEQEGGEKKPLKTYKSMVASSKSSARPADKRQGDLKPVMQGSSKITEEFVDLNEAVKPGSVKLKSGETVKMSRQEADHVNKAMKGLNSKNLLSMKKEIMKDKRSYMNILKFAKTAATM